ESLADVTALYNELVTGNRDHYRHEQRFLRRDGHILWAKCTAIAVRESPTTLKHVVMLVEDFTERKELAEGILTAREQEQQRLGQDLHDTICQNLLGIKYRASLLEKKLRKRYLLEADDAQLISRSLDQAVQAAYNLAKGL